MSSKTLNHHRHWRMSLWTLSLRQLRPTRNLHTGLAHARIPVLLLPVPAREHGLIPRLPDDMKTTMTIVDTAIIIVITTIIIVVDRLCVIDIGAFLNGRKITPYLPRHLLLLDLPIDLNLFQLPPAGRPCLSVPAGGLMLAVAFTRMMMNGSMLSLRCWFKMRDIKQFKPHVGCALNGRSVMRQ